jgi:hypothetical protein
MPANQCVALELLADTAHAFEPGKLRNHDIAFDSLLKNGTDTLAVSNARSFFTCPRASPFFIRLRTTWVGVARG